MRLLRKWRKYSYKALLIGLLISCTPHPPHRGSPPLPTGITPKECTADSLRYAIYQTAASYVYSVEVKIQSHYMRETRLGTSWQGKDGYLFTCSHVLPPSPLLYTIEVWSEEKTCREAQVLWRDSLEDVAILRAEGLEEGGLALSAEADTPIGQTVYSVGAPWGLTGTLQEGYIAAPLRLQLGRDSLTHPVLQLSLPAQPGSSGSPLLNTRGEVIGMIAEIASLSGHYEGVAFAIPASRLHKVLERYRSFVAHEKKDSDTRDK
ncbi:MAG: serine protease [Bacteroidia bacterium]|nr:serine protease [Bacteroidia bacterium]MDW8236368.1 serine protease [Bacteroidia bacterium]